MKQAIWAIEEARLYSKTVDKIDVDYFGKIASQEKGVIAVTQKFEGRANGEITVYYPWDGSTEYGSYPYAITNPHGGKGFEPDPWHSNYRQR